MRPHLQIDSFDSTDLKPWRMFLLLGMECIRKLFSAAVISSGFFRVDGQHMSIRAALVGRNCYGRDNNSTDLTHKGNRPSNIINVGGSRIDWQRCQHGIGKITHAGCLA